MFVWCVCGLGRSYEGGLLCFRVVLGPDPLELVQVMRAQNRPITRQVIKVVHDDGDKQVDDLKDHIGSYRIYNVTTVNSNGLNNVSS